jgi:hypothetical protein
VPCDRKPHQQSHYSNPSRAPQKFDELHSKERETCEHLPREAGCLLGSWQTLSQAAVGAGPAKGARRRSRALPLHMGPITAARRLLLTSWLSSGRAAATTRTVLGHGGLLHATHGRDRGVTALEGESNARRSRGVGRRVAPKGAPVPRMVADLRWMGAAGPTNWGWGG